MNHPFRLFFCAALAAGLCLTVSCSKSPAEPTGKATESVTETETETKPGQTEEVDTTDYDALAAAPFLELNESPAVDFTVSETADGVTVTGYTGSDARVRIPEQINGKPVIGLGDGAFRDCKTVHVLWIPDSVVTFGKEILIGTDTLYALHTPLPSAEGQRFIGWLFGAETYERNNMEDLRRIDFLEIGGSLTEIPAYAFFDCNDLITVRFPQSVAKIGNYAFARCASLKAIDVSQISHLGDGALLGCTSLTSLTFGEALESVGRESLGNCNALKRLELPFVGESRTEHRFLGWLFGAAAAEQSQGLYPSGLSELKLSGSAGTLAPAALSAAPIEVLTLERGLTGIGARALADCTKLRDVVLPEGVTEIGENAFSGCTALRSVTFPEGLRTIGINAFMNCTALTSVVLPSSLTTLPACCFMGCRSLSTVDLGGVATVGVRAFHNCPALNRVEKSQNVTFAEGNEAAESLAGNS